MQFICIMGISGSGKSTLESSLEQMGYNRSVSYTTRKPQIRNNVLETDGNEYKFVTEEKFMQLVKADIIIEFEKYADFYYGTPAPIGAEKHVAVVCVNGFKALKEKYGDQVIGIYLKCPEKVSIERIIERHSNSAKTSKEIEARIQNDLKLASEMERLADLVLDARNSKERNLFEVLKYVRGKKLRVNDRKEIQV